jgi:hypothetical protein
LAAVIKKRGYQLISTEGTMFRSTTQFLCQGFGGSARSAYTYAHECHLYDRPLIEKLATISFDDLGALIRNSASLTPSDGPSISHQLIHIFPDTNRDMFKVGIPTRYLYEKLRNYLSHCNLEATARMYSMFVRIPTSRATADYMLEDSVNDIFPNGGQWKIKRLKANHLGPKYTHRKADPNATTRYLLPWLSVP